MPNSDTLQEIIALRDRLLPVVSRPIEFPEPSLVLDLESRRHSQKRMFTHIHQLCILHREHYYSSNVIKHLYLLDAYIVMARESNSLGLYMVSRSMLELNAFFHYVKLALSELTTDNETDCIERGRKFFTTVVRARFLTGRGDKQSVLKSEGVDTNNILPWSIKTLLTKLESVDLFADAGSRYGELCEFVHHNLGSVSTANAGSRKADAAYSSGGGVLLMPQSGAVTQYRYPLPLQATIAVEKTGSGFLRDALACDRWMNEMPEGPYSRDLVKRFTGSPLGFRRLDQISLTSKVPRNALCPCGSNLKYKKCCLGQ